jgi:hypothetical protein
MLITILVNLFTKKCEIKEQLNLGSSNFMALSQKLIFLG